MHRKDYWVLSISFWPQAVEAGVKPICIAGYGDVTDELNPAYYTTHEIDFEHMPTRKDFLEVVAWTPWMSVWNKTLLPIIETNDWPTVGGMKKFEAVDLRDNLGRVAGRLSIRRKAVHRNLNRFLNDITMDDIRLATKGMKTQTARKAAAVIEENRLKLLERANEKSGTLVWWLLKTFLHEQGILKNLPAETPYDIKLSPLKS